MAAKLAPRSKQREPREVKESGVDLKIRCRAIIRELAREYPDSQCSLTFSHPFELLVATILSAQCTDARVNLVTPALFARFPTPQAMARASLPEVEKLIQSTGFYKNKARSLVEMSRALVEQYDGDVPRSLEALVELRGVGRKTANVVLGNAFDDPTLAPGVVVDTHVGRISRRLGLSKLQDPEKLESVLTELVPAENRVQFSHWLIDHGRAVCDARKPMCELCVLSRLCPRVGV